MAALEHLVRQALADHVAHARLRVGHADFQGNRVEFTGSDFNAAKNTTNLRSIPVRNHEPISALDRVRQRHCRAASLLKLLIDIAFGAGSGDRVAAQRHND